MITGKKKNALILCGHGSRSQSYKSDFFILKKKIQKKFKLLNIFHCFIEINQPSIDVCLSDLMNEYKRIFFFPLLIFEGKHMIEDIKDKINKISYDHPNKIILIDKISLIKEVLPITSKIIKKTYSQKFNILITSCSISKKKEVKKELEIYTKKLSKLISIKKMVSHFVGDEGKVLNEINSHKIKENKCLVHPIFLFNGYLFEKNIRKFRSSIDTFNLHPISHYEEIINLISKKLIHTIQTLD